LKDRDIPVVFLSSHMGEEIMEETKKITPYGYVVKDGDMTALGIRVKKAMKLHETRGGLKEKKKPL
ncbi:MAG TPA: hypothetical protein PKJ17_01550, partial [Syntrophorhabdaceae bacterium]|nr:hypothetical protein [Syntrophorhabdaceae bacterium]